MPNSEPSHVLHRAPMTTTVSLAHHGLPPPAANQPAPLSKHHRARTSSAKSKRKRVFQGIAHSSEEGSWFHWRKQPLRPSLSPAASSNSTPSSSSPFTATCLQGELPLAVLTSSSSPYSPAPDNQPFQIHCTREVVRCFPRLPLSLVTKGGCLIVLSEGHHLSKALHPLGHPLLNMPLQVSVEKEQEMRAYYEPTQYSRHGLLHPVRWCWNPHTGEGRSSTLPSPFLPVESNCFVFEIPQPFYENCCRVILFTV